MEKEALINQQTRIILYTLEYTFNIYDVRKWNYSSFREIYLMWNKGYFYVIKTTYLIKIFFIS